METKRHSVNLKQYRKVSGKWQFVPVARDAKGAPDPRLVVLDGEPTSSKGGTFYLEFKHHGKRRQESIGTVPREALEAWRTKCAVLTGLIEPEDEPEEVVCAVFDLIHEWQEERPMMRLTLHGPFSPLASTLSYPLRLVFRRVAFHAIPLLLVAGCVAGNAIQPQTVDRITQDVDSSRVLVLANHLPHWANAVTDAGVASPPRNR